VCPDTVLAYLGASGPAPAPGEIITSRSSPYGPYPISGQYGEYYIVYDSLYPGHVFDAQHDVVPIQGKDAIRCFDNTGSPQVYPWNF
jgi:hypothetical protein